MSHIVESCPQTKLNGGLSRLHSADEDAVSWLTSYSSRKAYEKKKKWFSRMSHEPCMMMCPDGSALLVYNNAEGNAPQMCYKRQYIEWPSGANVRG